MCDEQINPQNVLKYLKTMPLDLSVIRDTMLDTTIRTAVEIAVDSAIEDLIEKLAYQVGIEIVEQDVMKTQEVERCKTKLQSIMMQVIDLNLRV